jgi:hypothetical protein
MATKKLSTKLQTQVAALLAEKQAASPAPDFSGETTEAQATGGVLDNLAFLVERIRELTRAAVLAQQNLDAIMADINRLTLITIPEAMDAVGLKETTLLDGSKLSVKDDLNVSVTQANQAAAYAWLRELGHGAVIKQSMTVDLRTLESPELLAPILEELDELELQHSTAESIHHSTLKSLVKELLESGVNPPPSFSIHQFKKAVVKEPKK